jgi:hypothetical protein
MCVRNRRIEENRPNLHKRRICHDLKKCTSRRINLQEIFIANKNSFKELLRDMLQEIWSKK